MRIGCQFGEEIKSNKLVNSDRKRSSWSLVHILYVSKIWSTIQSRLEPQLSYVLYVADNATLSLK